MLFSFGSWFGIIGLLCGSIFGGLFATKHYKASAFVLVTGAALMGWLGISEHRNGLEQIEVAERQAKLVTNELVDSKARAERLQADVSSLKARLEDSRGQLASVSDTLEASRVREERLESSVNSLQDALSESRNREFESADREKTLSDNVTRLSERVTNLSEDNVRLLADLAEAQRQRSELLDQVDRGNAESAIIRQTVQSQERAQRQNLLRQRRQEHCDSIYSRRVNPDGLHSTSLGFEDPSIVGDGRCVQGRYYGPNEKDPMCMNC